jgi:hypothetical protein
MVVAAKPGVAPAASVTSSRCLPAIVEDVTAVPAPSCTLTGNTASDAGANDILAVAALIPSVDGNWPLIVASVVLLVV